MTVLVKTLLAIERAPMRTMTTKQVERLGLNKNAMRTLGTLMDLGAITRIARGTYTAPPDGRDGHRWMPTAEVRALAYATAHHGFGRAALTHLSAARYWGAYPRAVGTVWVAVDGAKRKALKLNERTTLEFVPRKLGDVDIVRGTTELGQGLVTSRAQTLVDLVLADDVDHGPIQEAIEALLPLVDIREYRALVRHRPQWPAPVLNMEERILDSHEQVG